MVKRFVLPVGQLERAGKVGSGREDGRLTKREMTGIIVVYELGRMDPRR